MADQDMAIARTLQDLHSQINELLDYRVRLIEQHKNQASNIDRLESDNACLKTRVALLRNMQRELEARLRVRANPVPSSVSDTLMRPPAAPTERISLQHTLRPVQPRIMSHVDNPSRMTFSQQSSASTRRKPVCINCWISVSHDLAT